MDILVTNTHLPLRKITCNPHEKNLFTRRVCPECSLAMLKSSMDCDIDVFYCKQQNWFHYTRHSTQLQCIMYEVKGKVVPVLK
jgi:hypothetical protein